MTWTHAIVQNRAMSTPQVRRATPADAATIAGFNLAMARESEGTELDAARLRRGVERVLGDPGRGCYRVAELDGRVVGCLLVTSEWSDWRDAWWWWIQSVYVHPEARRRGVYRALHGDVLRAAREDGGVCGVRLYVEHDNLRAQATYTQLGMQHARYRIFESEL